MAFPAMADEVTRRVGKSLLDRTTGLASSAFSSTTSYLGEATGLTQAIQDRCIMEVFRATGGDSLAQYSIPIAHLMRAMSNMPKASGDPVQDQESWLSYVDKLIQNLEADIGKPINEVFGEEFLKNADTILGPEATALFRSREAMIEMLQNSPQFHGVPERFLQKITGDFADHSISITDRFGYYLPEFIANLNPSISIIGSLDRAPPINLKTLNVIGFSFYDKKAGTPIREKLSTNPMEQFNSRPSGTDQYGNEYHYNYFGPNNPLPNGDPINELDMVAMRHDHDYDVHGYNTAGAKEADKRMVDTIKMLIDNGTIDEDSPHDQLKLAKQAMAYFSLVDVK